METLNGEKRMVMLEEEEEEEEEAEREITKEE